MYRLLMPGPCQEIRPFGNALFPNVFLLGGPGIELAGLAINAERQAKNVRQPF